MNIRTFYFENIRQTIKRQDKMSSNNSVDPFWREQIFLVLRSLAIQIYLFFYLFLLMSMDSNSVQTKFKFANNFSL